MRPPFRAKPKPFLDAPRRDWQFQAFAWLLRQTGGFVKFQDSIAVLPIEEHFPERGIRGQAGVAALFRTVRDHAGMADWPCMVEPGASLRTIDGIRVIPYDAAQLQPTVLVAHFARELARYLVDTFDEEPPGGTHSRTAVIDLAAVFMGFGVFMANAAVESTAVVSEVERIHALAMFCLLRGTSAGALEAHLTPHLRKYLRLATQDLAQYHTDFQRLRAERGISDIDVEQVSPASG